MVRRAPVVILVERRACVWRMELGVRVDRRWTEVVSLSQGTRLVLGAYLEFTMYVSLAMFCMLYLSLAIFRDLYAFSRIYLALVGL